jgi:hypothetical protein
MEVNYIVVVSLCCCNDSGVVGHENIPLLPYDLLELSHVLLEHTLIFHHKKNLGLFNVQAPIQVLAYGCLKGLSEAIYIVITKSNICLQHCCCTSSSSK